LENLEISLRIDLLEKREHPISVRSDLEYHMNLKDKTVIVTGATGGIGKEICTEFAKKGARLIAIAHTQSKLDELKKGLSGEGHTFLSADFTKTKEVEKVAEKIKSSAKSLDILINAAGVGVYKSIDEVEIGEWRNSLAINATAPFFLTKLLLPLISKSDKGVIINVGSGMGKIPTACRSVYCATKYALRGMTLSLAEEFQRTNITFIHIALGSTLTDFGPLSLKDKEEENLQGKAYLTPNWVAKKFVEIIEKEEFQEEIELYPSQYNFGEWNKSKNN
jgi:short-subunit dehydrogenase